MSRSFATRIADEVTRYREDYAAYYETFAEPGSPALRDANPSVVVVPGIGLFGFGKDKREARITTEFFVNAIHVMAGATALGGGRGRSIAMLPQVRRPDQAKDFRTFHNYVALPRREAFRIEYWALEEAKLQRMPPEKEFSRKVVFVVGGGSGIGRETALQIAKRGGHLVVADANAPGGAGNRGGRGGAVVDGNGAVGGVGPDVARRDRGGCAGRRPAIRGNRLRRQHRGGVPDAGSVHAGRKPSGAGRSPST